MQTTIIEPSAIERALFLHPPGSPADIAVHIAAAMLVLLPLAGFCWGASGWSWRVRSC
jgi:hypothetical protein